MSLAEELIQMLPLFKEDERAEIERVLAASAPKWTPQAGPQWQAILSPADVLFYGGQAGGGKSDALIGIALEYQEHSIIFRRQAVQLVGLEERITKILGSRKGYNSQDHLWRIPGTNRVLELGSVNEPGDWMKYQGRPHDAKLFDEITHFTEEQFRYLIGWMRTDNPKVRQRVVAAGNPPVDSDGEWVIRYWAPWLDENHPNPAKPGELRWFVSNEAGEDTEVLDARPVQIRGRFVKPKSRTFIPSGVDDNLFLKTTGYADTLMALPEPLRSMMAEGNFKAGRSDHVWQLIPTSWVDASMARWSPRPSNKGVMTHIGFDVARGGTDLSCAARRHDMWVDDMVSIPGVVTNDGPKAAAFITPLIRDRAPVALDGIGIGASALDFCQQLGMILFPIIGSQGSTGRSKDGNLRFRNVRAQMYWALREALDPNQPMPLDLPPDKLLRQELIVARYKVVSMGHEAGILVQDKDEIRKALGRSPDRADAIAMTFADEIPAAVDQDEAQYWRGRRG
jgi:Terminase large subunit, T4likevirus-type, N-terminal